jgi:hypothetical protein
MWDLQARAANLPCGLALPSMTSCTDTLGDSPSSPCGNLTTVNNQSIQRAFYWLLGELLVCSSAPMDQSRICIWEKTIPPLEFSVGWKGQAPGTSSEVRFHQHPTKDVFFSTKGSRRFVFQSTASQCLQFRYQAPSRQQHHQLLHPAPGQHHSHLAVHQHCILHHHELQARRPYCCPTNVTGSKEITIVHSRWRLISSTNQQRFSHFRSDCFSRQNTKAKENENSRLKHNEYSYGSPLPR